MLELVRKAGILLYSVHTSTVEPGTALHLEGQAILHELTSGSGGVLYTTSQFNERDVNEIFEAIATELRNQYLVAIEPSPATNERKWRKIKVKVSALTEAPPEMKNLSVAPAKVIIRCKFQTGLGEIHLDSPRRPPAVSAKI